MKHDTTLVPAAMAEECKETGVHFARLSFDNAQEAETPRRCEWTRGTFEGESLPVRRPKFDADDYDTQAALYDACEQIMDDAAATEWERLWDETPV